MSTQIGGGNKKTGRWSRSPSNMAYKSSMRWITNKIKKVKKQIRKQPNDEQAKADLKRLTGNNTKLETGYDYTRVKSIGYTYGRRYNAK